MLPPSHTVPNYDLLGDGSTIGLGCYSALSDQSR